MCPTHGQNWGETTINKAWDSVSHKEIKEYKHGFAVQLVTKEYKHGFAAHHAGTGVKSNPTLTSGIRNWRKQMKMYVVYRLDKYALAQVKVLYYNDKGNDWQRARTLAIEMAEKAEKAGLTYIVKHYGQAEPHGTTIWK